MTDMISSESKHELCKLMASNLSTLREKIKITQNDLATKVGLSRQTISAVETEAREMQWSTFSILIMFFANIEEAKILMIAMGLINDDVRKSFNIK
jgi:DNA-binding XRE family transcriptional regulator